MKTIELTIQECVAIKVMCEIAIEKAKHDRDLVSDDIKEILTEYIEERKRIMWKVMDEYDRAQYAMRHPNENNEL